MSTAKKPVPPFSQSNLIKTKNSASGWRPPCGSIPLENWCHENIKCLNKSSHPQDVKVHNINTKQRKALRELAKDKSLTIKPADKGGSIVVMDTLKYIAEGNRQLSDNVTYQKLDGDPTSLYQAKVESRVVQMVEEKEISIEE